MKKSLTDTFKLYNGVEIPCVGLGTWQSPDGDTVKNAVVAAINSGYKHIDTAYVYKNEVGVGHGIAESGIARKDLFVTTKLWNTCRGYEKTLKYFDRSLKNLGLDYVDMYLIHWPANEKQFGKDAAALNAETWKAFEKLYDEGLIRAIGLSNFLPHHIDALSETANIKPMLDQLEFHPGYTQFQTITYLKANGIQPEAWSPLGTGEMLKNQEIKAIADKYGVSSARLLINWCLKNDVLPLPKSITPSRIEDNAKVFDFEISDEDSSKLFSMPCFSFSGLKPDDVDF